MLYKVFSCLNNNIRDPSMDHLFNHRYYKMNAQEISLGQCK